MRTQLLALLVVACLSSQAISAKECQIDKLLERIRPTGHDLSLTVDSERYTFYGGIKLSVTVSGAKDEPADLIAVRAGKDYRITGVNYYQIHSDGGYTGEIEIVDQCYDNQNEIFVLQLNQDLPVGTGLLIAEFEGAIRLDGKGIYRNEQTTQDKSIVKLNLAGGARQFMPSFDDPQLMTDVRVVVITSKPYQTTSSVLELEEKQRQPVGYLTTHFKVRSMSLNDLSLEVRPEPPRKRESKELYTMLLKYFFGKVLSRVENL